MNMEDVSIDSLITLIANVKEEVKAAKARLSELEGALATRLEPFARNEYEMVGKDSGTLTFERDGHKFKAEIRKTVTWDNDKLQAVAASLPWTTVERLFDIKFSVPETRFKAISDDDLLQKVTEARTTKLSDMKISCVE